MVERICSMPDCDRKHQKHGLCAMHAQRVVRTGTTDAPPTKPTPTQRFWAKVDIQPNGCWLWTGARIKNSYGEFSLNGRPTYAHRFAYQLIVGPIPTGLILDHKPTCPKHCVNPLHLRPATQKQNMENRSGPTRRNTSGVLGVRWRDDTKRWSAEVRHNRRTISVGCFSTLAEAEAAVVAKRLELFTHNDLDRARAKN